MSSLVHDRPRDTAQRWGSIVVGLAVVGIVSWMTYEGMNPRPIKKDGDAAASAASASSAQLASNTVADGGGGGAPSTASDDLDGGLFLPSLSFGDAAPLPTTGGPRTVKMGVILVAYQGAEGAPPNARNKQDARVMAERLATDARSDFHQAVTGGDPGSSDDIGRIPRGVLDPRTEASVFMLAAGEVSDVLETPKGYWIVRRID